MLGDRSDKQQFEIGYNCITIKTNKGEMLMKYLLLISHGGLAEGLRTSLAMFAGDQMDQVLAIGLKEGEGVDAFGERVQSLLAELPDEAEFVVLADIVGGSPLTTALEVMAERGKLETATVLGGMNLTMALTTVVMKDLLEGSALVQAVLAESATALQEFSLASDVDADDDDI